MNSLEVKFRDKITERVQEYKYLRLILAEKITWKKNSLHIHKKILENFITSSIISKKNFGIGHLKRVYAVLYESVFSCGIIRWEACEHKAQLKILQNTVGRIVLIGH